MNERVSVGTAMRAAAWLAIVAIIAGLATVGIAYIGAYWAHAVADAARDGWLR